MGNTKTMMYKEVPVENNIKDAAKAETKRIIDQQSTPSLLWVLVKRHKVGLLATGNVILVLNWAIPQWTTIAKSLLSSLI